MLIVFNIEKSGKRNRTRTKNQRTIAKKNADPTSRLKNDANATTSKRGREQGGTPPNASQATKRIDKKLTPNTVPPKETSSIGTGLESNIDGDGNESNDMVPPVPEKGRSIGSSSSVQIQTHPNDSVPPVTSKQSIGSESNIIDLGEDEEDDTYASVSKLCKCVIDQREPGSMTLLDQNRFDKLNAALIDLMMSQIGKNIVLPEMDDVRLHIGTMRVRCINPQTIEWLEKYVPTIDVKKLWKDAKLVVIDFKDIPKPFKFNVWIRGIKKSPQDIFKLLEAQNVSRGITTKSWTVLHSKFENGGTSMTIGVGHDSFESLVNNPNSLYCGVSKAVFTMIKSCKENLAMLSSDTTSGDDQVEQMEVDPAVEVHQ